MNYGALLFIDLNKNKLNPETTIENGAYPIVIIHGGTSFIMNVRLVKSLKVVSATLVSFLRVKESIYQTRKRVFYFTSKALSILEKIKF